MEKRHYKAWDLDVYFEKLDNGLEVYLIPMEKFNSTYVQFTSKYGSVHNNFKFKGETEYKKMPPGIAHFLEHKMFENEDGVITFDRFSENGADCNANTSNERTCYLFSARENIEKNINFLLDYVQKPHFTDENVSKEKGIIIEEAKMYENIPDYYISDVLKANTFHKSEYRIPIIGTIDSIKQITKEQLQECYDTFYHPSNMFVTVSGNFDVAETLDLIKRNQANKKFPKIKEIELFKEDEPKEVFKEKEILELGLESDRVAINYKIARSDYLDLIKNKTNENLLATLLVGVMFSDTSEIEYELKKESLIIGDLDCYYIKTSDYLIINIEFKTEEDPDYVISKLDNMIGSFSTVEKDFSRKKKHIKVSIPNVASNIYGPNNSIVSEVVNEDVISYDLLDEIDNLSYDLFNKILKNISFKNKSVVIAKKKV